MPAALLSWLIWCQYPWFLIVYILEIGNLFRKDSMFDVCFIMYSLFRFLSFISAMNSAWSPVNAESLHGVWNNLFFLLCAADNFYCLVNIKRDLDGPSSRWSLSDFFLCRRLSACGYTSFGTFNPAVEYPLCSHHLRLAVYKNIEIASVAVFKGREPEQPGHQVIRISWRLMSSAI